MASFLYVYLVSRTYILNTREMSNSRSIHQRHYMNAIERCKNIFVQSYNMKSIPSAASENRRVTQRRVLRGGEVEGREGGLRGRKREERREREEYCESCCIQTIACMYVSVCVCAFVRERNVMFRDTI